MDEQGEDQVTPNAKLNRRDMTKLLGVVTALSTSLGVTFTASARTLPEGAQLKLKFFQPAPGGDPAKARLLCSVDLSPEDQKKLTATEGPVELRMVAVTSKISGSPNSRVAAGQEITLSSSVISKTNWSLIKDSGQSK